MKKYWCYQNTSNNNNEVKGSQQPDKQKNNSK